MGTDYSVHHAAVLAVQLPQDSRVCMAIDPDARWGMENALLNNIEYWLHWLAWSKTEDGYKGRNVPRPIWEPSGKERAAQGTAMTIEELDEFLAKPRREV